MTGFLLYLFYLNPDSFLNSMFPNLLSLLLHKPINISIPRNLTLPGKTNCSITRLDGFKEALYFENAFPEISSQDVGVDTGCICLLLQPHQNYN